MRRIFPRMPRIDADEFGSGKPHSIRDAFGLGLGKSAFIRVIRGKKSFLKKILSRVAHVGAQSVCTR
jgi:hypothetical protein